MADDETMRDPVVPLGPWEAPASLNYAYRIPTRAVPKARRYKKQARRLKTSGAPRGDGCVVYAVSTAKGVKIGVSARLGNRIRRLSGRLLAALPVTQSAAREVEARTLEALGRLPEDRSEWVAGKTDEDAVAALHSAWRAVSRYMHVDPALTPDEARRQRIALAIPIHIG